VREIYQKSHRPSNGPEMGKQAIKSWIARLFDLAAGFRQ
jgi:hypothetical protein